MANWHPICNQEDLVSDSGICALVKQKQLALFFLQDQAEQLFALDNCDPFSNANVIYRGITGCVSGEPVVASPMYKQRFSLKTGQCIEDQTVKLNTYAVRLKKGRVEVQL